MKNTFIQSIAVLCLIFSLQSAAQEANTPLNIIVFGAHPDDCDNKMGGTAALFAKMGHHVKFVSVTNGDAGHYEKGGGHLAKIRRSEAQEAGKRLGIQYTVLDNHDGELFPTLNVRHQIIREIRNWDADVVLTHRPVDYHPDHRYTGVLVQDAAYLVIVPNVTPDTPALKKNPVFLYLQDHFQKPNVFKADIAVDITSVFETKMDGLDAHQSQFYEWLPWTEGKLDMVPEGEKEKRAFLTKIWGRSISPDVRKSLTKWYGPTKANAAKYAEAFEICEYGKQPTDEEIKQLFPMLNK
ncbi:PIG-L deacetylase family protein [Formosa algae]|uniref:LmbE family N-acetylglucosaminyl deacetylase n=1 Tax=Formosa algae TaxID=225843 RepID=A0A9X0YJR7_9FLAO|nr:PIG-L family deacetylase [Formosa algae]MBP1839889.1 LmbE family N-acetylglucosaminyl deacetylase [Formosa algae]MDQ0335488.1 LmbE family N-acetylglucosaminyl deacetylase [Formosa algae]OEI81807.1 GlcNAc-PI de-N-acetylase [Formosa algae]